MQPLPVIKVIDVTVESIPQFFQAVKCSSSNELDLQAMEKLLHTAIIGALAQSVHALPDIMPFQFTSESITGKFYAWVSMEYQASLWLALPYGTT